MQGHLKTIAELTSKLNDTQSDLDKTKERLEKSTLKRAKDKYAKVIPVLKNVTDLNPDIFLPSVATLTGDTTEAISPSQSQEINTSSDNSDDDIAAEEADLEYREGSTVHFINKLIPLKFNLE
jgi:hypothetical protein